MNRHPAKVGTARRAVRRGTVPRVIIIHGHTVRVYQIGAELCWRVAGVRSVHDPLDKLITRYLYHEGWLEHWFGAAVIAREIRRAA